MPCAPLLPAPATVATVLATAAVPAGPPPGARCRQANRNMQSRVDQWEERQKLLREKACVPLCLLHLCCHGFSCHGVRRCASAVTA